MPGEQVSIYELLRILVRATRVEDVPGADRQVLMSALDAFERFDLLGERERMASAAAQREVLDQRNRERIEREQRKNVRQVWNRIQ